MRPTPFLSLHALLILAALLAGCSERAARIAGNERLVRGEDGLGATTRSDTLVDRDTFVPPTGTAVRGTTLLVGQFAGYETLSLFRVRTWNLPDTSDPTLGIDTVFFRIEFDADVIENLPPGGTPYSLYTAAAAWDTAAVEWPGPPLGTFLGSGPDATGPFTIDMGAPSFGMIRSWASDSSFAGFVLVMETGQGIRGFKAGTGRFEIVYHRTVAGLPDTSAVVTTIPTDLSVHTPLSPGTGGETVLPLGGLYRAETLLRAPIPMPPAGFSINGARFVAYLDPTIPAFPAGETAEIRVYRIRNAWTEGVAADSGLGLDAAALATLSAYRVRIPGDSIVIPIPVAVAREWSADSASNHGVLLRVTDSFKVPEIRLRSRESAASPPVLRLNTTSPPPGRF